MRLMLGPSALKTLWPAKQARSFKYSIEKTLDVTRTLNSFAATLSIANELKWHSKTTANRITVENRKRNIPRSTWKMKHLHFENHFFVLIFYSFASEKFWHVKCSSIVLPMKPSSLIRIAYFVCLLFGRGARKCDLKIYFFYVTFVKLWFVSAVLSLNASPSDSLDSVFIDRAG